MPASETVTSDDKPTGPGPEPEPGAEINALQPDSYLDTVEAEISFSRATGYDKEQTAVVPLAELARREEERLRMQARGEPTKVAGLPDGAPPGQGRTIPLGEIVDVLRAARTVEEVAGVLVEIVANVIPRVLLLWERNGILHGFASRGMKLTEVKLLTIELPRSIVMDMAGTNLDLESYRGPPRLTGQVPRLLEILGAHPPEMLLIPVYVTTRDRWVLYADNGTGSLPDVEQRLLEVVVSRAAARADILLEKEGW